MSRWDVARERRKGNYAGVALRPSKTEAVRCSLCGVKSRVLAGTGEGWRERHLARKHPTAQGSLF